MKKRARKSRGGKPAKQIQSSDGKPKTSGEHRKGVASLHRKIDRLTRELGEARQQQAAAASVFKAISSSMFDLEPILDSLIEHATKLGQAEQGFIYKFDGEFLRMAADFGASPEFRAYRQQNAPRPGDGSIVGRSAFDRRTIHIPDILADPDYKLTRLQQLGGFRSMLSVPLVREDSLVGVLHMWRTTPTRFTDQQVQLVTSFADQAVIAIENARLFENVQQHARELSEALDQQTATFEVLRAMVDSVGELEMVFETILANAIRICEAEFGTLYQRIADSFKVLATHGAPSAYAERRKREPLFLPPPGGGLDRLVKTMREVHIPDIAADKEYPADSAMVRLARARTTLTIPMMKEDALVGAISIYRIQVRPFSDPQIQLVKGFASQAVIAMENARLLSELRQRTADLSESLQQQMATADVLKTINRSTFDLQAVLNSLVETAARTCDADRANIWRPEGDRYRLAASHGTPPEYQEYMERLVLEPGRKSISARTLLYGRIFHVHDVRSDPEYPEKAADTWGNRTVLSVPLLRTGTTVGAITLTRRSVKPFTEREIEMVSTFADQAVIAIENVRLFEEIRDKGRQLETASQHKSQFLANMSHELRTPLNAILGYIELILDNIYGETPERMRGVLDRVQSNGKHLLGLINDVLDLSRIEAGQLTLSLNNYSIMDVVHNVFATVESLATEKKLALKVDLLPPLPTARGDERRLTQVLLNLVGNAIKFTDSGEVSIRATAANDSYTLSVRDTGPGIDPADQVKIFEEFQQADSSVTKKKGGAGLGLAIARRIIEMHGGRIWVESSLGRGAKFSFTVPLQVEQVKRI